MLNGPGGIDEALPPKVGEIMNKEIGAWQLDGIQQWNTKEEECAIQEIPVHEGNEPDLVIWPNDKSGVDTVKSGYATCKKAEAIHAGSKASSSNQIDKRVWKEIWQINAPSKVKVFLWRMCKGALATNEELWKRKCRMDPLCVLCGQEAETVEHMILLCDWTRKVWWEGCLGLKICKDRIRTIDQWFLEVFLELNNSKSDAAKVKSTIAYTCWVIWNLRCQAVMQHKEIDVSRAISWIFSAVNELYTICHSDQKIPNVCSEQEHHYGNRFRTCS
ncbi:hypothetical protein COLO4_15233 [Corchorus olitorius]|uniref:Reverse transcriptase zinc-binding domain-containing protein n=1 Tax=Corchorus olitorius TaxID=93759 RepID=A0A1R3JNX1_9ROSI|nr:hypothetical protein COLO4_15233 [Corchorus olitorius]